MHFLRNINRVVDKNLLSLLNQAKNYITADVFNKAIIFFSLPILTRILSPSDFGYVSIFVSLVSIFEMLFELNYKSAISRYYFEEKINFSRFLGSSLIFLLAFNSVMLLLLILIHSFLSKLLKIPELLLYSIYFASILTVYINIYLAFLQSSKKSNEYFFVSTTKGLLTILLSLIFVVILPNPKYYGYIIGSSISLFFISCYSIIKMIKNSQFKFHFSLVKEAIPTLNKNPAFKILST